MRTCSQCFAPRCWPVRKRCYRCGAARDDLPVSSKGKGNGKVDVAVGPLGRKPPQTAGHVPPTTRRPQVVPPRGPPGAGAGSPPTPESPPSPPSEELVKALQLLQSVLTPEDFSKYDKKFVPPKQQERVELRERELLEAVERQANYKKQEQKHLEMIAKHEHNLAQQKAMLESVRSQLAEVRDTVGALRALVSETKEPPITSVVPPLPPPREPRPPPLEPGGVLPTLGSAQDFLPIDSSYTQIDFDTDMEEETGPIQSKTNKKRVLMKLKGSSSSVRRETVKYEASSGKDLARALAKLSPGGMNEFVQSVPVNVAGFLMRSAAQSAPLRLWSTEYDTQDDVSNRGGPAAIEACGSPSECSGPQSAKPGLFSAGEPASVFTGTAGVVAGAGSLSRDDGTEEEEAGEGVLKLLVPCHLLGHFLLNRCLLLFVWASLSPAVWCRSL